jgi:hypothetical protein
MRAQKSKSDDPLGLYIPLSMSDGVGANSLPAPNGSCAPLGLTFFPA